MTLLGTLSVNLDAQAAQLQSKLRGALGAVRTFSEKSSSHILEIGASFAALGLASKSVVSTFSGFQSGMVRAGAIAGATDKELKSLEQTALDLAKTTKFTGTQVGEAYQFMAMAGQDTKTMLESIEPVLKLASAGNIDLGQSADVVTGILKGFGKETGELGAVTDTIAAAMTSTKVSVDSLGEAFKTAGPAANAAGMELTELTSLLGMLGDANIDASTAGNAVKRALMNLVDPKQEKTLKKLGLTVKDGSGELLKFSDIIRQLEASQFGLAEATELFGRNAAPAMLAIVQQGSERFDELNKKFKNSAGLTDTLASKFMDTMGGSINQMNASVEAAVVSLGKGMEPAVRTLASSVGLLADAFSALPGVIQSVAGIGLVAATGITGIAAATGGAMRVLPVFADGFDVLGSAVKSTMLHFADMPKSLTKNMTNTALLKNAVKGLGESLLKIGRTDLMPLVKKGIKGIGTAASLAATDLKGMGKALKANLTNMPALIANAKKLAKAIALLSAPVAALAAAATAVGGAARLFGTIAGGGKEAARERYGITKDTGFLDFMGAVFTDGAESVGESVGNITGIFDDELAPGAKKAGEEAGNAAASMRNVATAADKVSKSLDFGAEGMDDVLPEVAADMADLFEEIGKEVSIGMDFAGETIKEAAEGMAIVAQDGVVEFDEHVKAWRDAQEKALQSVQNFAESLGQDLGGEIGGIIGRTVGKAMQSAAPQLGSVVQGALQGFATTGNPFGAIIGAIMAVVTKLELFNEVLGAGEEAFGAVIGLFNKALRPLTELVSRVSSGVLSIFGLGDAADEASRNLRQLGEGIGSAIQDQLRSTLMMLGMGGTTTLGGRAIDELSDIFDFGGMSEEAAMLVNEELQSLKKALETELVAAELGISSAPVKGIQSQLEMINDALAKSGTAMGATSEVLEETAKEVGASMTNVPQWFKTGLERFRAAEVEAMGGASVSAPATGFNAAAFGASVGRQVSIGEINLHDIANPREFLDMLMDMAGAQEDETSTPSNMMTKTTTRQGGRF